jgi:two-component system, chemotaxis family, sensor kinase CheA
MSHLPNDQADFVEQLKKEFLDEVTYLLEQCEEAYLKLENPAHRVEELSNIFRVAHSIKGSGAVVGFDDLASFAHVVEDCLTLLRANPDLVNSEIISLLLQSGDAFKVRVNMLKVKSTEEWKIGPLKTQIENMNTKLRGSPAPAAETKTDVQPTLEGEVPHDEQPKVSEHVHPSHDEHAPTATPVGGAKVQSVSVKVDPVRIEAVLDLVGELVVIKSQLLQETQRSENSNLRENEVLSLLDKTVRELQDKTLSMRMTSLKPLFLKVQRTVRDVAIKLNKPVDFEMNGEDIEIDRTMIELLSDPLIHIVRNAVDHGIEKGEVRKERGKNEKGSVHITAKQSGGRIVVEIKDDGGGISKEKVKAKAVRLGLVKESQALTDQEIYDFIFAPGFSTADQVTDVSGRGVGLDVVKSNIHKLKGTIEIESKVKEGSLFRISLPLTTAITEGIVVFINQVRYVIPMDSISELLRMEDHTIAMIDSVHECMTVRGKVLPLIRMNKIMKAASAMQRMNIVKGDFAISPEEGLSGKNGTVVVVDHMGMFVALTVDGVIGQNQVVVKPLGTNINTTNGVAGAAIMGDGKIALVLDIDGLVRNLKNKKVQEKAEQSTAAA